MINIEKFANPNLLWLILIVIPMICYYIYRNRQGGATIQISTTAGVSGITRSKKYWLRHVPFALRCLALALIVIALARPQSTESNQSSTTEGIDIVMSLDISGSMLARDFEPDRITAAKEVAQNFFMERPNDRIGLVVFAGESFTQSPITTDKATLITLLAKVQSGMIEDGTAIGNGLATAVNRLKESNAKSKVIILLTDGVNNSGQIAPMTAAEIAKALGIRVYTIGVGTIGVAPYPAIDPWGQMTFAQAKVEIDEEILTNIAEMTGGKYFRATDNNKLRAIYEEINSMEKTKVEVDNKTVYFEDFFIYLTIAMLLLVIEFLIKSLYLRQIP